MLCRPDENIADDERFDFTAVDISLDDSIIIDKFHDRGFCIHHEIESSSSIFSAALSEVQFNKGGLSVVYLQFCLALQNILMG